MAESSQSRIPSEYLNVGFTDSILCHILSYLPTKDVVCTSILSRRRQHVWKDLHFIHMDDMPFWKHYDDEERHARFDSFVNATLAQRNADTYHIQKFRLKASCSEETISTWLAPVIVPSLQELYLELRNVDHYGDAINVPEGIFTCPSLKSLVLKGYIRVFDGPNVYLPSLKNLDLNIPFVNIHELLSGCPAIENLSLYL
ncbi:hypothetical protein PIB30_060583 [Stylosanthes scabra]|uniref:F-box domain-containing protein n=1 Tax=Stylosanthes scabra TaxID=79078 RepID=A0ABU6YI37_9FABA|nr:hypothetical protein [Stylosanthes scabra]